MKAPFWISQAAAMALTGRSVGTVRRWIRTGRIADTAALHLLQLRVYGQLLHDGWQGWRVVDGALIGPDGRTHEIKQLETHWVTLQLVGALRRRCDDLERELGDVRRRAAKRHRFRLVD
ncbi:MAG: phage protein [Pseudomonadales bacterium]|nr:phage protein [Pseudomonadales bacterium]